MNSISGINPYTVAPGSQASQIRPEADLSYEESNAKVDQLGDSINQARDTQASAKESQRTAVLGVNNAQLQQSLIDTYTSTYSGTDNSSSNTLTYSDIQDTSKTVARAEGFTPIANNREQPNPAEQLLDKIRDTYQPVTTQPIAPATIDLQA